MGVKHFVLGVNGRCPWKLMSLRLFESSFGKINLPSSQTELLLRSVVDDRLLMKAPCWYCPALQRITPSFTSFFTSCQLAGFTPIYFSINSL